MAKHEEPTPCPPQPWVGPRALPNSYRLPETDFTFTGGRSDKGGAWADDCDTENLDFTTELRASLRNAAPRRRAMASTKRRTGAWKPEGQILEDVAEAPAVTRAAHAPRVGPAVRNRRTSIMPPPTDAGSRGPARRGSILAQPAHRPPLAGEAAPTRPTRRRVSAILAERESAAGDGAAASLESKDVPAGMPRMKKDPRRRTIFVPSDDTTIMTIHPGASLDHQDASCRPAYAKPCFDLVALPEEQPSSLAAARPKKAPRKSLAAAPKRAPLQHSTRVMQGSASAPDIAGNGGGKENIPPGALADEKKRSKGIVITISNEPVQRRSGPSTKPTAARRTVESSDARKRSGSDSTVGAAQPERSKAREEPRAAERPAVLVKQRAPLGIAPAQGRQDMPPARLGVPRMELVAEMAEKYPVLLDDISEPHMYEDSWLSYQETAITQLLNALFDSAGEAQRQAHDAGPEASRTKLLRIYHEPPFPLLHKRLQASLLYGALSVPKDQIANTLRLRDDVGLKRSFLNLWLDTYDLTALRAAAEVVVGRQIPSLDHASSRGSAGDQGHRQTRGQAKKALESFLDTFLVRNDDATRVTNAVGSIGSIARGNIFGSASSEGSQADFGSRAWSWRRTVIRSLMLILLLDKGRCAGSIRDCLFQDGSPDKSSVAVLRRLAGLVLPSPGDISKTLGHLNYHVTHTQHPLQEYRYRIDNLATDMRDGVRLTRLVELLLYPSSPRARDEDITIAMPAGELLLTGGHGHDGSWALSHHLKVPSTGRAQKAYNVQIALAALDWVANGTSTYAGVTAEDIVNGHREKTVGLLWGLVSKWGLSFLVDWDELGREVTRLTGERRARKRREMRGRVFDEAYESGDEHESEHLEGLERHTSLLKAWASIIALLHGLRLANLSTSFADGRIFESIVDEYAVYLPTTATGSGNGLEAKLKRLGCSNFFAALFRRDVRHGRVFDKDFVVAGLAFMCSRLLQSSVKGRAATRIQRAYRRTLSRRIMHKRAVLLRLAYDCQTVVATRDRVIGAATVLQRAWRACLRRKIDGLVRHVTLFQARARAGMVRKSLALGS
ncbi:MAG: hypothetical protein M1832_001144 [Thelocarpon impressellum]|nr:MAG: hypothetical protein M1832_001144 [Thelocarpon impressellum]